MSVPPKNAVVARRRAPGMRLARAGSTAGLECWIALEGQAHSPAEFGRLVDRQDQFHGSAALGSVDHWRPIEANRLQHIAKQLPVTVMPNGGRSSGRLPAGG